MLRLGGRYRRSSAPPWAGTLDRLGLALLADLLWRERATRRRALEALIPAEAPPLDMSGGGLYRAIPGH